MKKIITLSILAFCLAFAFGQKESSIKNYKAGTKALESNEFSEAISLLTLSIKEYPTADAYYNRAVAFYYLGDSCSFCNDLKNAANLDDSDALELYSSKCTFKQIDRNIPDSLKIKYPKISHLEIVHDKCSSDSLVYATVNSKSEKINIEVNQLPNEYYWADSMPVFTIVQEMPEFAGGDNAKMRFLAESIKYPQKARDSGIQGTVFLSFIINADGSITNISILRSPHESLSDEAIRVMKLMPKWKPGKQNGKPVRVQFNMPIKFTLAG